MSKWPKVALGEVCDFRGGGTPSRKNSSYFVGDIPWATVKDFKGHHLGWTEEYLSSDGLARSAANLVEANTVLVVSRVGLGKVALATKAMAINQDIKALIPKVECEPRFLLWAMQSKASSIERAGVGATVKGVTLDFLKAIEIPLPPLEEQRRIVVLLDRAAEIRRRAEAARDKARAIIPALFVDMFGDPATNPKGWDVVELGEVLESAQYGTSQKANEAGQGQPVIRMGNVTTSGDLDTSDLKHIMLEGKEYENAELREGDILFNRTNSKELVGKTGIWDGRFEAVAASYFIRLRVDRAHVAPEYVWCFMNTPHMKKVLFNTARGAIGQSNINAKELRAFKLPLPDKQLQDRFASELRAIKALTARCGIGADIAANTQTALSAEVFA